MTEHLFNLSDREVQLIHNALYAPVWRAENGKLEADGKETETGGTPQELEKLFQRFEEAL